MNITLGTGRSVHIAYMVGDRVSGSLCDRAAWESKKIRRINAEATCSRCAKVEASDSSSMQLMRGDHPVQQQR